MQFQESFFIVEDKIEESSNKKIVKDEWYGPDSKCLFGCISSHETLIERRRLKCVCEGNKKVCISHKLKVYESKIFKGLCMENSPQR